MRSDETTIDLDLEPVKFNLIKKKGWDIDKADSVAIVYVNYMRLMALYPDKSIVPTEAVDEMWHMHILDTKKYSEDCSRLFGRFIHHFPYYGIRSESDGLNMKKSFEETLSLYETHFNSSPYVSSFSKNASACDDFCTSCDTGNCQAVKNDPLGRNRPSRTDVESLSRTTVS